MSLYEPQEPGPSRRRHTPTTTLRLPDPTAKARVKRIWRNITERPSLLSSSSDSNHHEASSQFATEYSNPDGDPRLYAESRRRSRGRNRRLAESRIPDGDDDGDGVEDEKEAGPTSRTVVDNNFSAWIDSTTGRQLHHEISKDDTESIRSDRTSIEETETSHYGKLYKAADACHMSWLATFVENVGYFLSMSFPEKIKERSYLKDVSDALLPYGLSADIKGVFCAKTDCLICFHILRCHVDPGLRHDSKTVRPLRLLRLRWCIWGTSAYLLLR